MSDLVERSRVLSYEDTKEAADRIEQLERVLAQARELLSCVETCSRNNFYQLAAEQLEAIDEALK